MSDTPNTGTSNIDAPLSEEEEALMVRYERACHAVQSGVKIHMAMNAQYTEPKHLRVGIDLRAAEFGGLIRVLIKKGVLTRREYLEALTHGVEDEVARSEAELSQQLGSKVTLI